MLTNEELQENAVAYSLLLNCYDNKDIDIVEYVRSALVSIYGEARTLNIMRRVAKIFDVALKERQQLEGGINYDE